jgi:hypothetical protein
MKLFTKGLLLVFLLLSFQTVAQQASDRITGFFPGVSFERFMELTEKESAFRFYFKKSDIEGLTVNLQANNDKLEDVLGLIFLNTELKFSISKTGEVFISKGQKLTVDFPETFFSQISDNQSTAIPGREDEFVRNRRYTIGVPSGLGNVAKIRGQVISLEKGEPISGAIVYEKFTQIQTITDKEGRYELSIPFWYRLSAAILSSA